MSSQEHAECIPCVASCILLSSLYLFALTLQGEVSGRLNGLPRFEELSVPCPQAQKARGIFWGQGAQVDVYVYLLM